MSIATAHKRSCHPACRILAVVAMLVFVPACRIPHLRPSESSQLMPDNFGKSAAQESLTSNPANQSAQLAIDEFFNDPKLTQLIQQALVQNRELKILNEEIEIAKNEVLARRGAYLPFVTAGGGIGLDKSSRFTREGAVDDQLTVAPDTRFPNVLPSYGGSLDIIWQLDIWRQLRNARDAARLRYQAAIERRTFVTTQLVAEVAENYYKLLALDKRIETLDKTILLQQQSLEAAKAYKLAGRGTELAVQRFQAEVRKNESEKLIVTQEILITENKINFIMNRFPEPVDRLSSGFLEIDLKRLSVGVPSQLLANRADIRQAERELEATGLDIKVARARFFPTVTLTAGVGYSAFDPKYLFYTPESLIANLAGGLVAPVINKSAIRADYMTANAKQLQAVYNYQRTILNAFTQVVNRLSMVDNYRRSIEIKKQQLDSLEGSVDTATKLFQNARAEYVEVLLAQRDLLEARLGLIEMKKEQLAAVVNAYQALGGGARITNTVETPVVNPVPELSTVPMPLPNPIPAPKLP